MVERELPECDCVTYTSDDVPLTGDELDKFYENIDQSGWKIVDDHHLEGTYVFEDFRAALNFTYAVGELAEEEWHHPDLHLSWGEVVVEIGTHTIDGFSETDFIMAARMDRIYDDYAPCVLV